MDKINKKHEKNRINNLQWAAAEDYNIKNFIIGENLSGNPDFYLNLIIGLSVKFFGEESLNNLFDNWEFNLNRNKYDMITIYLLEDLTFKKEVQNRRVLSDLRKNYAREFLDDKYDLARKNLALKENLFYSLQMKRAHDILDLEYDKLSSREQNIYKNLYLCEDTNSLNIEDRVMDLLKKYANYRENFLLKSKGIINFNLFSAAGNVSLERSNMPYMFKDKKYKRAEGLGRLYLHFMEKHKSSQLSYIENIFGAPLFNEEKRLKIEREIATEGNSKSKIYFTSGIEKSQKNLNQELNEKAIERHLLKFNENKNLYKSAINTLSKKLKLILNSLEVQDYELSSRGKLISKIAYKSLINDKKKIFEQKINGESSNLKVDLILDASASLLDKESDIAIEAYILSKSLQNNNISNRIISYQSVNDYTILTILKDYSENAELKGIFRYKSMGWNRDGFFFKAYKYLVSDFNNLFSIIITDANPSDLRPYISKGIKFNQNYSNEVSLEDTKKSIAHLKKKGLNISAILNSDKIENAHELYKDKFVKISKIEQIANVAGKFIQKELRKIN